jgi:hypothetical protein
MPADVPLSKSPSSSLVSGKNGSGANSETEIESEGEIVGGEDSDSEGNDVSEGATNVDGDGVRVARID